MDNKKTLQHIRDLEQSENLGIFEAQKNNGEYFYYTILHNENKNFLSAVSFSNSCIFEHYKFDIDSVFSIDNNLQEFIEHITERENSNI